MWSRPVMWKRNPFLTDEQNRVTYEMGFQKKPETVQRPPKVTAPPLVLLYKTPVPFFE